MRILLIILPKLIAKKEEKEKEKAITRFLIYKKYVEEDFRKEIVRKADKFEKFLDY